MIENEFDIRNSMTHIDMTCPICGRNDYMFAETYGVINPVSLSVEPQVWFAYGCHYCNEVITGILDPDMGKEDYMRYLDVMKGTWYEAVGKDPNVHAYATDRLYRTATGLTPKAYWEFRGDEEIGKINRHSELHLHNHSEDIYWEEEE